MPATDQPTPYPHLDALLAEAGWVLALARRLARDQAAAEDIAQSTLALALEQRPAAEGGLRPWLARVVGSLARRATRGDARRRAREALSTSDRDPGSPRADDAVERFELQQDLARRVGALPEPYRAVLIRRYYEGLSVKEIARATGVTPGTVRSQIARGLERVRLQYDHDSGGRGALGAFLIASGSSSGLVARTTAQLVTMQTTTKFAMGAAAVLAAALVVIGSDLVRSEPIGMEVLATGEGDGLTPVDDAIASAAGSLAVGERMAGDSGGGSENERIPATDVHAASSVSILRARILDGNLRPLAGATLRSIQRDGRPSSATNVAKGDGDGRVVLELTDDELRMWRGQPLEMMFAAGAAEHATVFVVKQLRLHGEVDLGEVRLDPGGTLVGICVDAEGRPIADAVLYAADSVITEDPEVLRFKGPNSNLTRPVAISDADGSFELPGIPAELGAGGIGSSRLWAHAPGRLWTITEPFMITPGGRVDVGRIVLAEPTSDLRIDGVVLGTDGRPAAGASIDYLSMGVPLDGQARADERGRFRIIPRDDSYIDLVARAGAGGAVRSSAVSARRGDDVELQLLARPVLSITITDTEDNPVFDASVRPLIATSEAGAGDGRLVPGEDWAYSDREGRVIMVVPGQDFMLWAKKRGFGSVTLGPFEHDPAQEVVRIALLRGPEVSGRVLAYGEPVEGARVTIGKEEPFVTMTDGFPNLFLTANGPNVLTDSDGRFVVPLERGGSRVPVAARREGLASSEVLIDVRSREEIRGLEIHMTEGGAIEGTLIPPPGMEASGLYVAASRGDGRPVSTRVDAEGRYRLEGLTPGDWLVEGRRQEISAEMVFVAHHPDDKEFRWNATVVDRQTLELEVDMRHLGDVAIQGELRIDGAIPPPGWTVEAVHPLHEQWRGEAPGIELDGDGRFAFTSRPGRVDLRFTGQLPGGATVEMLREVHLRGARLDWVGTLRTAVVEEALGENSVRARFVRGDPEQGDRERTLVAVGEEGVLKARVPVGSSTLEVLATDSPSGEVWTPLRSVRVR